MTEEKKKQQKSVDGIIAASNNIVASFKTTKFISIASLVALVIVAIGSTGYSIYEVKKMQKNIYVIDNKGQVLGASAQNVSLTRGDEVKDQSRRFHELFFNLPPDASLIESNIENAMSFSDKSAYSYYRDRNEAGFYKRLITTGSYQQIIVDSVKTDMRQYPYPVVTYATQYIVRETTVSKYSLVTRCIMMEVNRTPKNVHGLEIQRFEVVENNAIEQRRR